MKNYTYYPMHMHLHSCFQSGASMESHMYNAKCLGMKYIRFTDHDSTICRAYVPNIDFSEQQLDYTDENGIRIRFDPIGNEEGRCILLTNPIYIVNTDNFSGQIPECRIYRGAI